MLQWFLRFSEFPEFNESSTPFRGNSLALSLAWSRFAWTKLSADMLQSATQKTKYSCVISTVLKPCMPMTIIFKRVHSNLHYLTKLLQKMICLHLEEPSSYTVFIHCSCTFCILHIKSLLENVWPHFRIFELTIKMCFVAKLTNK